MASTSARLFLSLCVRCTSLVAMKVWIRGNAACLTASQHALMSPFVARASPWIIGGFSAFPTPFATAATASASPRLANGNPASITSTPRRCSCLAIRIFSSFVSVAPGLCSPSRSVVSITRTRAGSRPVARSCFVGSTTTAASTAVVDGAGDVAVAAGATPEAAGRAAVEAMAGGCELVALADEDVVAGDVWRGVAAVVSSAIEL
mmetsp:Transcript_159/g.440  ORF Transcript_159/g.440 Transcript_159/m.440 type:complete len:205 (+) Transcript_159:1095-1709(+)